MGGVLVLGYGNDLRGDDGVGRWVAEAVASARPPGVEVRVVHQLAPELAVDVLCRRRVIFVDAAVSPAVEDVVVQPVRADPCGGPVTHHRGPASVLAVAAGLGAGEVEAFLVTVPAHDLGLGSGLSAPARRLARAAVDRVLELCADGA
jgi:hydrogenase maturation protease